MFRHPALVLALAFLASSAVSALAGVATPHRLSFQGHAVDASHQPVLTGNIAVRIYDQATGGTLVYDSGSEFNGAISNGVFSVLLGGGTPLVLDNTRQYYLELDINGGETIGDSQSGRQAFWPGGGDHSRSDLEARIQTLEAMVNPQCNPNTYNLNGNPADGCEFTLDPSGIYVDPGDPAAADDATSGLGPSGTGSGRHPTLTIAQGLARAAALSRTNIYVANGTYNEAITLANGRNLRGGYKSGTWERQLGATATVVRGESVSGFHRRAVAGSGITSPTLFEGFVIFGPVNSNPGGNSYAVYLSNAGGLTFRSNVIFGGIGGPGSDGASGAAGANGVNGSPGGVAFQVPTSTCSSSNDRIGGAGGVLTCGVTNISGGAGGGNRCTPVLNTEYSGLDGITAAGTGGGTGGDAGDDGQLQSGGCTPPSNPSAGAAGSAGASGASGAAGLGASTGVGQFVLNDWSGSVGGSGGNGGFGLGGGGGGAGGGADAVSPERDILGGAGGGGGSGACGGTGGAGGGPAGGSFGVFAFGGSAPTIQSNVIVRGFGGAGGRGGAGGPGGLGGQGALGGTSSLFCAGAGGRGGNGGAGGHGGGGGGAAGGISCGIYTAGLGVPNYGSNTITGGAAGAGGAGGSSFVNAGSAGASGTIGTVISN